MRSQGRLLPPKLEKPIGIQRITSDWSSDCQGSQHWVGRPELQRKNCWKAQLKTERVKQLQGTQSEGDLHTLVSFTSWISTGFSVIIGEKSPPASCRGDEKRNLFEICQHILFLSTRPSLRSSYLTKA